MSDAPTGPDWWQASDGKWYPPPHPGADAPTEAIPAGESEPPTGPAVPLPAPTEIQPTVGPPPTGPPTAITPPAPPGPPVPPGPVPPPGVFGPPQEVATPKRNKLPLVIGGIVVVLILAVAAFLVLGGGDDDEGDDDVVAADNSPADDDPADEPEPAPDPPADDEPADEPEPGDEVDPDDAEQVEVVEQGFTVITDPNDDTRRNLTYGILLENPNPDPLVATGIDVQVSFFDAGGSVLDTDTAFLSVLLPGQTGAVGNILFDAPEGVAEASRCRPAPVTSWSRRTSTVELDTKDVKTVAEEFGGLKTTFLLTSTFPEAQEAIQVTAIYRDDAGKVVGGYFTFIEFVEANDETAGEISFFIDVEGITETELFPMLGFDFAFEL